MVWIIKNKKDLNIVKKRINLEYVKIDTIMKEHDVETRKCKTPEEYEQLYFPMLEEQDKICTSEVQKFSIRNHTATPQEIMYIIDRLEEYKKYFLSYQSLAQYLDKAGRPKMLKRLNEIIKDTDGAIQIFQKMYQSTLNANKEIFRIQKDVQQYGVDTMKKVYEYRRQKF